MTQYKIMATNNLMSILWPGSKSNKEMSVASFKNSYWQAYLRFNSALVWTTISSSNLFKFLPETYRLFAATVMTGFGTYLCMRPVTVNVTINDRPEKVITSRCVFWTPYRGIKDLHEMDPYGENFVYYLILLFPFLRMCLGELFEDMPSDLFGISNSSLSTSPYPFETHTGKSEFYSSIILSVIYMLYNAVGNTVTNKSLKKLHRQILENCPEKVVLRNAYLSQSPMTFGQSLRNSAVVNAGAIGAYLIGYLSFDAFSGNSVRNYCSMIYSVIPVVIVFSKFNFESGTIVKGNNAYELEVNINKCSFMTHFFLNQVIINFVITFGFLMNVERFSGDDQVRFIFGAWVFGVFGSTINERLLTVLDPFRRNLAFPCLQDNLHI